MDLLNIIKISRLIVMNHNDSIRKVASRYNLSFCETDTLNILSNNKNIFNAKDIVSISKSSKAYVSKALNLLEEKKYISVKTDELDKRKQKIVINKRAHKIIKELNENEEIYLNNILKNIKEKDINKFIEIQKEIANNILKESVDNEKNI